MRFAVIACQVLCKEICRLVSDSGNICTPFFLEQGLHNTPELLNKRLCEAVESVSAYPGKHGEEHMFDAILLGYGLCCNGIIGVEAREIPIIVPRSDDCIGLLLGSYQTYLEYFRKYNGIYWFNPGWIDYGSVPTEETQRKKYQKYVEQFGDDNADYLMEQEQAWIKEYSHAIYITPPNGGREDYAEVVRKTAEHNGWNFLSVQGKNDLLQDMIEGRHDERFLVCPPGYKIAPAFDESKITAVPI